MKNPYQIVLIGDLVFGIIPTSAELITIKTIDFSNLEKRPMECYAQVKTEDKINQNLNCFLIFLIDSNMQEKEIKFMDTLRGKTEVGFNGYLSMKDLHPKIKLALINIIIDYYVHISRDLDVLKKFIAGIDLSVDDGKKIDSIDITETYISFLHTKDIYPFLIFYKDEHQTRLIEHASLQRTCSDQDGVRVHRLNFEIEDTIIGNNATIWLTTREGLLYSALHNSKITRT